MFKVTISVPEQKIELGSDILINTTEENISKSKNRFCMYHTPFEGILTDLFNMKIEKTKINYNGILKKKSISI